MPAPSTCLVSGTLYGPGAAAISGAVIKAYVTTGFTDASGNLIPAGLLASTTSASDGTWSLAVIQTQALGHSVTFQFEYPLGNNQSASRKYAAVIPAASTANFSDLVNLSAGTAILAASPTTDALPEGTTNLYFTSARAAAAAPVQSVNTRTGAITLTSADVGLGNANNTSDANKPVSTAQAAADAAVQAYAIQRANHTGTQLSSTISDFTTAAQAAISATSPLVDTAGVLSIPAATNSVPGYLTAADHTSFAAKQAAITTGTTAQYLKGDLSLGTLDTSAVPENANLYYTNARADARIALQRGANSGIASLDSGGKVPLGQLPASLMEYQGTWNASTNSPTLADGTGTSSYFYRVQTGGTQNLGSGAQTFIVGDWVMYNGAIWQLAHSGADAVTSVNGYAGVVTLAASDVGAQPLNSELTAIAGLSSNGLISRTSSSTAAARTLTAGSSKLAVTNGDGVSGNPTVDVTEASLTLSNLGGAVTSSQLPTVPLTKGGTGQTTQQASMDALAGTQSAGTYLRSDGTHTTLTAIQAADVPTLNQNTTGTAANVTGTVLIAKGGTGQTTAQAAIDALLPPQTSNSGKFLTTNGTTSSWAAAGGGSTTNPGIYTGYFPGNGTNYWQVASSGSIQDFALTGTAPALTQVTNLSFGTVTIAASNLPGVAFTAPKTGYIQFLINAVVAGSGSVWSMQLYETNTAAYLGGASGGYNSVASFWPATISGFLPVTASTAYNVVLRAVETSATVKITGDTATDTRSMLTINMHYVSF